jgi:acetyltransferase EpsM
MKAASLYAIYGAGGFGAEVADLCLDGLNMPASSLLFVDSLPPKEAAYRDIAYGGSPKEALETLLQKDAQILIAVGSPSVRERLASELTSLNLPWGLLIHPSAMISGSAALSEGSIVSWACCISSRARLGTHCVLNLGATVGHDVKLGNFCTLQPRSVLLGNVNVGNGVEIGAGALVYPGVSIGDGAKVGLGSIVIRDVPPGASVAGNPARIIANAV